MAISSNIAKKSLCFSVYLTALCFASSGATAQNHSHAKPVAVLKHAKADAAENKDAMEWKLSLISQQALKVDVPATIFFSLSDASGVPVGFDALKTVHTKKMHGLLLDATLTQFHHVHPKPDQTKGIYQFSFTPRATAYRFYANVTDVKQGIDRYIPLDIGVDSKTIPPVIHTENKVVRDGYHFSWNADPLRAGGATMVAIEVRDDKDKPVKTLQPVLGAFAHMVGFSVDRKSVVHVHPIGDEPTSENARGGSVLRFHVITERAGDMIFYLQVKIDGKDIFVPFGQKVAPALASISSMGTVR